MRATRSRSVLWWRVGEGEVCELEVHQPALQAVGVVVRLFLGQHEHAHLRRTVRQGISGPVIDKRHYFAESLRGSHPRVGIAARQFVVFLWLGVVDGEELAVAAGNDRIPGNAVAAQVGHPRDVKHSGLDRVEARGNGS